MLILPAIDIRGGRCVRLTQGDFARETVYDDDPAQVGRRFEADGARMIHVVDLDGAKAGTPQNLEALERTVRSVAIPVQFGGGARSIETIRNLLTMGVDRVVVGSALAGSVEWAAEVFAEFEHRVVAGLDCRDGVVSVHGWLDSSGLDAEVLARQLVAVGCQRFVVTDISKDGTLEGPNLDLLSRVITASGMPVIASGGVSSLGDLALLQRLGCEGAIVGKAIYEGRLTVSEMVSSVGPASSSQ